MTPRRAQNSLFGIQYNIPESDLRQVGKMVVSRFGNTKESREILQMLGIMETPEPSKEEKVRTYTRFDGTICKNHKKPWKDQSPEEREKNNMYKRRAYARKKERETGRPVKSALPH